MSPGGGSYAQVEVDLDLCVGHGNCYAVAPSCFQPDDAGRALVVVAPDDQVDVEVAERAALLCPEGAITVRRRDPPR